VAHLNEDRHFEDWHFEGRTEAVPAPASLGVFGPTPDRLILAGPIEKELRDPPLHAGSPSAREEVLLDRLLDRFEDRLRHESLRHFGPSGGDA
jgi:hypothetical protein